jgi:hypothetical protein
MRCLVFPALAVLGGTAWWLGAAAGRRHEAPHPAPLVRIMPAITGPASGMTVPEATGFTRRWRKLRLLPPAAEARWLALDLFRAWARQDADEALEELSGPGADHGTLWPAPEALRQFYSVWATVDPDRAWAAALEKKDPVVLDAVAEGLAPTRPDEVLASDASPAVKLLAKAHQKDLDLLSVTDEGERLALLTHRLMSGPLTKAGFEEANRLLEMMGQWETEQLAKGIAGRLIAQSRDAVLPWLQAPQDPFAARHPLAKAMEDAYAASIPPGNVEEALALPNQAGWEYDPFGPPLAIASVVGQWDTPNLIKTISSTFGNREPAKAPHAAMATAAVKELLQRDPAALLVVIKNWPPGVRLSSHGPGSEGMPALTSANAASVKELILSAPAGLRVDLMEGLLPFLVEMDLPFAAEQVSRLAADPQPAQGPQDKPWQNAHGLVDPDKLIGRWLEADTAAAAAWLEQNPDVSVVAIQEATRSWAADPGAWSQWLNTLPPGHRKDAAILGGVRDMVWHDPEAAFVWVGQIQDPLARASEQEAVLRVWSRYDPAAADAFPTGLNP